jgi:hypothetical protein
MEEKICRNCQEEFETEHGNTNYCSTDCYMYSKKVRQRKARDAIKPLLNILLRNHKILDRLWTFTKREYSMEELNSEGLDTSLCRILFPNPDNKNIKYYDFGAYSIVPTTNSQIFKILKNEINSSETH